MGATGQRLCLAKRPLAFRRACGRRIHRPIIFRPSVEQSALFGVPRLRGRVGLLSQPPEGGTPNHLLASLVRLKNSTKNGLALAMPVIQLAS
jgi:hypothetical protein